MERCDFNMVSFESTLEHSLAGLSSMGETIRLEKFHWHDTYCIGDICVTVSRLNLKRVHFIFS